MICLLCFAKNESHFHLFLFCTKTMLVWKKNIDWIGLGSLVPYRSIIVHVFEFNRKLKGNI